MESVWPAKEDVDLSPEVERHLSDLRSIKEGVEEVIDDVVEAYRARVRSAFE